MASKLRRKMGLSNAVRMRLAIANMAAAAGGGRPDDPRWAHILADVGQLIEDVDASLAHYDVSAALAGTSGTARTMRDLHSVNQRIQREISVASQALESLRHAFSGQPSPPAPERTESSDAAHALCLWQQAFEASVEAIVITDGDERILSVNRAVTEITGYAAEELIGQTPRVFHSGRHDQAFFRDMWSALLSTGHWQGEIWDRRKNGEIYPKWLSISAVSDHNGRVAHYIASFSDITARKNDEERVQFLAYHDPLTGLPNRRRLQERFELESAHARRNGGKLHLLFLDLDHFKDINDELGHVGGDKFLQVATSRLKSCLRVTDIISRVGGDEFVILLSDTHGTVDLPHIVAKLLASLEAPIDIDGHAIKASTSIGVGIFPDDGESFETLLHRADIAMYEAKQRGRGSYVYFDDSMNVADRERADMERHLRDALDRGEISLLYEARVRFGGRGIASVEALLHWEHPQLGAVSPDRLLALAEACGLTARVSAWVLRHVCRQARAWQVGGRPDLTVAVKLAPSQYRHPEFVDALAAALADSKVAAGGIELGFSEAVMLQQREAMLRTVQRVKELGVRLLLDGFGSGVSSLGFLQEFTVDRVKLDRALVAGLPNANGAMVRAAIQMAACLNLDVIADGVANESQVVFLHAVGCDLGQGPLFGSAQADPLSAAKE